MAKAVFHKGQRVYVKPVGTWAQIEAVLPQWVKGVEEPLKVTYEVGLGREFQSHELISQEAPEKQTELVETEKWRVMRRPNRWEQQGDVRHSRSGSYPVVVTDERDWGGWRVPVSEYERDPARIELQARVLANALKMLRVCRELTMLAADHALDTPAEIMALAAQAEDLLASIAQEPDQPAIAAE